MALPTKAMALVAYLTLEPGPHPRDELATLLWGESVEAKARASLRQALKVLRGALGESLRVSRAVVELEPRIQCDVTEFLAATAADPDAAVRQDVSRVLTGLSPRRCPGFDDWAEGTRNQVMARYHHALAERGRVASAHRNWRHGVELGELWLRSDPLSNQAAHLLIESLYLSGDTSAALARYAEFSAQHEAALGAAPDFELRELVKRLDDHQPSLLRQDGNDDWHQATRDFKAALVGRDREWQALTRAWSELHGESRVVVVEGEVGAGKTRLADDFDRWVTTQGAQALRAFSYETGAMVRFGTVLEACSVARSNSPAPREPMRAR